MSHTQNHMVSPTVLRPDVPGWRHVLDEERSNKSTAEELFARAERARKRLVWHLELWRAVAAALAIALLFVGVAWLSRG